ncbi:MAG: CinA family protein [Oscillospiraceae bacterium]|nr:CinA family protein [Oscillospiraceae bacterium]
MSVPHSRIIRIQLLVQLLKERNLTVATAESCTGGLLGKQITDVPGSSAVYPGGVISYCNRIKRDILGVDGDLLDILGPVSEPVARQMAEKGPLRHRGRRRYRDHRPGRTGFRRQRPAGRSCVRGRCG